MGRHAPRFELRARFRRPGGSHGVSVACASLAECRAAWLRARAGVRGPEDVLSANVFRYGRRFASVGWSGRLWEEVRCAAGFAGSDARELDDEGRPL